LRVLRVDDISCKQKAKHRDREGEEGEITIKMKHANIQEARLSDRAKGKKKEKRRK
jgi:hypothetical protein